MTEEHVEDVQTEAVEAPETHDAPDTPEVQEEAPKWSREDAEEAKLFGWKAPDEWQGEKPEGYIDNPEEYLGRVQRSRIFKTMQEKLEQAETTSQEQARKLEALNQRALERQRESYEVEISRISQGQRRAVEEGDTDAYDALERQRQNLKPVEAPAAQANQGPPPEIASYMSSNDGEWLNDPVLRSAGADIIERTPGAKMLAPLEQAEFAQKQLQQIYPDRFPKSAKPQQPVRNTVDPGGLAPAAMSKRSAYDALPSDAKTAFKRYVGEGLFADTKEGREEFANEYNAA